KVCCPRPPATRSAKWRCMACSTRWWSPIGWPTTSALASSSVWRIFSPPGTSPTPVRPLLSVRTSRLRVKNGPCAPLRFSSMLSRPATGITRSAVMRGVELLIEESLRSVGLDVARGDQLAPARVLRRLVRGELLGRVGDDFEAQLEQLGLHGRVVQRRDDGGI